MTKTEVPVTLLVLCQDTLKHAKKKLEAYRDHSNGEYHGGVEHTRMIGMIKETQFVLGNAIAEAND